MYFDTLRARATERVIVRKYDMTATFAHLPAIFKNPHRSELIVQDAMRAARNSIRHFETSNSTYDIRVAKGHRLPLCPDSLCFLSRLIANRSARAIDSRSSCVRSRRAASLRMSERCCSSSSLTAHSIFPVPYWIALLTCENMLLAFAPIKWMVPIRTTRITASIIAYSAISWPSSDRKIFR